jgi:anaerobic ribonucleoside-triphosphate reductase
MTSDRHSNKNKQHNKETLHVITPLQHNKKIKAHANFFEKQKNNMDMRTRLQKRKKEKKKKQTE